MNSLLYNFPLEILPSKGIRFNLSAVFTLEKVLSSLKVPLFSISGIAQFLLIFSLSDRIARVTATTDINSFRLAFQQHTKNSFKSDVALKHAFGQRPAKKAASTEIEKPPARAKKATPAASTAILTFFHGIVPFSNEISLLW